MSLCSLVLYAVIMILTVIAGQTGVLQLTGTDRYEVYIIVLIMTVMAYVRHKDNIKRLLSGTERKTYIKKKGELGEI